jgi:hypothetical protein
MKNGPGDHNPLHRSPYCGDPGALVSYLYNDGSPHDLAAIEAHVQACDLCTAELAALGDTRELISAWSPPQTELGLTLTAPDQDAVPAAATVVPAVAASSVPWWRQATPVWMQAVAATMVFAAGMAIGATGRGTTPAAVQPATAAIRGAAATGEATVAGVSRRELADLEQRLRTELARLTPAQAATTVQTAARTDDEALMKRFRALLNESEERQQRELALRTAQVLRDIEIQRKVDIATLQQNIGQFQGATGAELRQQRELINRIGLQGPR